MLINNRYTVIRNLGEGGFGQAYLAEDTQMPSQRQCVIKQLKPIAESPEVYELVQARFQREAAILEQLGEHHRQIPRLYAYFTEDKYFYLVQEWIEGETLEALSLPLPEQTVHELLTAILPVLAFIHDQGIIHRDIKPGNIILRSGSQQPVLIDFGAVKETINTVITGQNSAESIVIGTPGYMPAEQAAGRPLASSDLYSLALTAMYLLTGVPPQMLPSDEQTGEFLWPQTAGNVSSRLVAVLTKAIQYHPRDRYSSAQDMLTALIAQASSSTDETLQPTVINTRPVADSRATVTRQNTEAIAPSNQQPSPQKVTTAWYRSPRLLAAGIVLLIVGMGTVFGGNWITSQQEQEPTDIPSTPLETSDAAPGTLVTPTESDDNRCFKAIAYDPEDTTVNVRDTPDGSVIDIIPNLSIVQPDSLTVDTGWNKISIAETESQGYIWGDLLYRTSYQVNDPEDTFANLRETPNGDLITAVENGTEVEFLGVDGDWTQVQLSEGQTGFIATSLLIEPDCF